MISMRLARHGAKKRPYYYIVVADARAPRDGKYLEKVGTYNPMLPREHESRVKFVEERVKYWIGVGAQPTDRVARMLAAAKLGPTYEERKTPKKSAPRAKAQERMKQEAAAAAKAAEAAAAPASAE
ncbi:MAG: 30S ribosomal protein S16 [Alphaproteobacteria bacterium]|nr:30S ribosomal protein S16 [Alphaproteobacteria bacterium]